MPGIMTIYLGKYKNWDITVDIALGIPMEITATANDGRQFYSSGDCLKMLLNAVDEETKERSEK
jgi:hypothetical protein